MTETSRIAANAENLQRGKDRFEKMSQDISLSEAHRGLAKALHSRICDLKNKYEDSINPRYESIAPERRVAYSEEISTLWKTLGGIYVVWLILGFPISGFLMFIAGVAGGILQIFGVRVLGDLLEFIFVGLGARQGAATAFVNMWLIGILVFPFVLFAIYTHKKNKLLAVEQEFVSRKREHKIEQDMHHLMNLFSVIESEYMNWLTAQNRCRDILVRETDAATASIRKAISEIKFASNLLDVAEREFKAGGFVAFWDAIEKALSHLSEVKKALSMAGENCEAFDANLVKYSGSESIPVFSISGKTFDEATKAAARLSKRANQLSYVAQRDFQFAMIYEQRRNTTTLVHGFRSLGEALDILGSRVESAIWSLEITVSNGFARITDAMDRVHQSVQLLSDQIDENGASTTEAVEHLKTSLDSNFDEMSKLGRFTRVGMVQALKNDYEMLVMLNDIRDNRSRPSRNAGTLYGSIFDTGPRLPRSC